jgi:hypothetical protein
MTPGRTAYAVMAKVPAPGEVKTRLCPPLSPAQAAELARCFLLDRLEQLAGIPEIERLVAFAPAEREAELRAVVPHEVRLVPQRGSDLGARLDTLLTGLLREGYAGAVAVDADSPTVPTAFLIQAGIMLRQARADVVLGPCDDGGYYLIGLRRPAPALFVDMPWSTAVVAAETEARAERLGLAIGRLPQWFDVDREADLARLRAPSAAVDAYHPRRTLAFLAESCP